MIYWMETITLLFCPPKPRFWCGKLQTTCWISCLAKVLKVTRNMITVSYQMVISWQINTLLHLNIQHIRKQIWRNYTNSIKDFWSIIGQYHAYLWNSMGWKKVFMMQSPLLLQSYNKYLPLSFSPDILMFSDHNLFTYLFQYVRKNFP